MQGVGVGVGASDAPSPPALFSVRTPHRAGGTGGSGGAASKPASVVVIRFPVKGRSWLS